MYQNFQLDSDVKIEGYEWKCEQTEFVICLVHGIGEHAGRYDRMAESFKEAGISMVGMDLRGHGFSSGKRGHAAPRMSILKDVDRLVEYCQREYPGIPLILYGHSMGGNIVLDYRKRGTYRTAVMGYLVTSPWIILRRKISKPLYLFALAMFRIKPDFLMNAKIPREQLGNAEVISKQINQHLIHDKISVMTALEGLQTAELLMNGSLKTPDGEPQRPMLLMHGDSDMICDPEGSRILAKLEKEHCRYIEWKGLYHEIHNGSPDSDGMEVVRTMIGWIRGFKEESEAV